ncbi:hypothetical protein [Gallaecimonas sp. GXIMD4217]|uniref:hypothetical protein n=1 Tax=Gallaecimonas sp. GXIMD4217 TaxID=3131927 RepID=UPI00311AE3DE
MTPYIVLAVIAALLIIIVVINVVQQQKQKQEAERRQELARQKAIIDETEELLPVAGSLPISSALVAMLYARLIDALKLACELSGDKKLQGRISDAESQYQKAKASNKASDDNIQLPDNEKAMVTLIQATKKLSAVLKTEFNRGKVDADSYRHEAAFLDRLRLKINMEGLISRGVSAKIIKQFGTARQFLGKAKQLAMPHAGHDAYLAAKLQEVQQHLDEIAATKGANLVPQQQIQPEQGEEKPKDELDQLFAPKRKW